MKVAYIVSLFPKISETFILRELEALRDQGVELTIISLKRGAERIRHPGAEAFMQAVIHAPSPAEALAAFSASLLRRPRATLAALARVAGAHLGRPILLAKSLPLVLVAAWVARRLEAGRVDHVHAHWATYPAQVAWTVHALTGIPYSLTAHAHDIFLPNPMLAEKVLRSSFTATISEFNRRWIAEACGPEAAERLKVVRCGVPLEEFAPRRGPAPAGGGIVSVGRLVDYKGFPTLIDAVGILAARGCRVRCTIVGDGPMLDALRDRVASAGLEELVHLAGERTIPEVRDLLSRAEVCVLASQRGHDGQMDGIPVVLMEAMALGVPAVATRISGIPELVEEGRTGLLVPPRDPAALAGAVERILDDPELAAGLARAARRRVEEDYDVRVNAAGLLGLMRAGGEGRG